MCGVPYHAAEAYISRLIAKGYKVAICEQMEDPATAKGLVDRDIVRIITPGTVIESSMLDESRANYLASVCADASGCAVCFADISTGEVCATSFPAGDLERIYNEVARFAPAEAILNHEDEGTDGFCGRLKERIGCMVQCMPQWFDYDAAVRCVLRQFDVSDLGQLGLEGEHAAVCAVGALFSYIADTQKTDLSHMNKLDFYTAVSYTHLCTQPIGRTFRREIPAGEERIDIKPGPAHHDGQFAAGQNLIHTGRRVLHVAGDRIAVERGHAVHHMVGDAMHLFRRGLGGADVHMPVNLHGVRADDLAVHGRGQRHAQRCFSSCCRAGDHGHFRGHRIKSF